MPCEPFNLNGVIGIACSRGHRKPKRYKCKDCDFKKDAPFLCDYKLPSGKDCDRPCCADHCTEIDTDRHLCFHHKQQTLEF